MTPRAEPLFAPDAAAGGGGLSEADLVLLSAYLDGELEGAEREALAGRIEREPALKAEYQALRASHDVLIAAARPEVSALPAPSESFAAFGSRLSRALPDEVPVAEALQPSWFRRIFLVGLCAFGGLLALLLVGRFVDKMGGPKPSGWALNSPGAKVKFIREGRVMNADGFEHFLAGDELLVDAQASVLVQGPVGVKVTASGPAKVSFWPGEVHLEEGRLAVEGTGMAARDSFFVRTPDGDVRANGDEEHFQFEVATQPAVPAP
ncbi:MAG: hypothetical protein KIS92_05910 [Planctomycetota bacterium]|nr:hypothetical protein [Planctomycetota bacterium]